MDKTLKLKAEIREQTGSKSAEAVRSSGRIPAIVYGHKENTVSISLDKHDFSEGVHHGHRLIDVQMGKKKETVIIKDLQYDHLGKDIIHADLMRVDVTERIRVNVPIELKGTAKGTHNGGIVESHLDSIEVECAVTQIPEAIVVRIADMDIDDILYARDLALPEGVKLMEEPGTLVVACHTVAEVKTTEELETEAPTAPEVIGKAEEEGEEAEQEKGQ